MQDVSVMYEDLAKLCAEMKNFQQRYPGNTFLDTLRVGYAPTVLPQTAPRPNLALMWEIGVQCQGLLDTRLRYMAEQKFIASPASTCLDRRLPDDILSSIAAFAEVRELDTWTFVSHAFRKAGCLDTRWKFKLSTTGTPLWRAMDQHAFFRRFGMFLREIDTKDVPWAFFPTRRLIEIVGTWKSITSLTLQHSTMEEERLVLQHLSTASLTHLSLNCLDVDFTQQPVLFPVLTQLTLSQMSRSVDHMDARLVHHLPVLQSLTARVTDDSLPFAKRHLARLVWDCRASLEVFRLKACTLRLLFVIDDIGMLDDDGDHRALRKMWHGVVGPGACCIRMSSQLVVVDPESLSLALTMGVKSCQPILPVSDVCAIPENDSRDQNQQQRIVTISSLDGVPLHEVASVLRNMLQEHIHSYMRAFR